MLTSITPLGERGRRRRWGVTAAWYLAGSLAGGAATGAALGAIGSLVPISVRPQGITATAIVAAVLGVAAVIEAGWAPVSLPSLPRQVSETWLDTYRGWVVGAGFGFQLGLAVVTIITSPATHAMLALMLLTHSPVNGIVIGLVYGAARAMPVFATSTVSTPERLARLHARLDSAATLSRSGAVVAMALLAAGAVIGNVT